MELELSANIQINPFIATPTYNILNLLHFEFLIYDDSIFSYYFISKGT